MINPKDFEKALNPKNWSSEQSLHTPTFTATICADGTLWLSGAALSFGFSVDAAQALTTFLSDQIKLPDDPESGYTS